MFTSVYTKSIIPPIFKLNPYFLAFHEKACQPRNTRMMNIDIFLARKCAKYDECSRFYIIMNDRKFPNRCDIFHSHYINRMIVIESNICSEIFQEVHQIYYMRFDSSKMNPSMSGTENIGCYEILRCRNGKSCIEILLTRL